jgi:DNA gyrase/topoisomerase IV subunit B
VEKHGECVKRHGPDALWVSFSLLYPFDMQAKELREQHNAFLDEELMAILSALLEEQHNNAEIVADLHSKLAKAERAAKEAEEYLLQEKEHYSDLEAKLNRTQEVHQLLYFN